MSFEQQTMVVAPPTPLSPTIPDEQCLSHVTALARFEFEPGRGNEGTKILMVEWKDDDNARDATGSWNVSWPGKSTTFPADDNPPDNIRRLYFLLNPGNIVPAHITVTYLPSKSTAMAQQSGGLRMNVNPLPAIFTPELGATVKASGKKGVLHTIWAKKRLQVLEKEISKEQDHNLESIALEMATSEKQWIEQNFGLAAQGRKPMMSLDMSSLKGPNSPPQSPGMQSPRSPGGRALSEKLKGLSIVTSEREKMTSYTVSTPTRELHLLSPEIGDMAVSSFSAFRDAPPSVSNGQTKRVVAQAPPEHIRQQQSQGFAPSLNFVPQFQIPGLKYNSSSVQQDQTSDDPDDLFAVALSPRAPNEPLSPFSIPTSDVSVFSSIKGTQARA